MITVRPMHAGDIAGIAASARRADVEEMRDGAGVSIEQALEHGLARSLRCALIMAGDLPLAAFGDACQSPLGGVGIPWLVSTDHITAHARGFLRVCRPLVADMLTRHQVLINYVDARNVAAIRWLEWLGFEMSEPMPAGVRGLPFKQFSMSRQQAMPERK
jgi:hypothetical protein